LIHIAKPARKAPKSFLEKAEVELKLAKKYFGRKRLPKQKFEFNAYRNADLRDSLNQIFCHKCAYCESFYGATQPVAIEHFRPKGMITEEDRQIKPGYWWLAAKWENLLPSCTDCNSPRKRIYADGQYRTTGKGNQFPLQYPAKRARTARSLRGERPLLLDPSNPRVRPERHVEFVFDDKDRALIRPALMANGKSSQIGETSIRVYALDRDLLVRSRQAVAKRLLFQLQNTEKAAVDLQRSPKSAARKAEFERHLNELGSFLKPDQPYLGMCRQLAPTKVGTFLRKKITKLIDNR
jgi:hypothetical protein